MAHLAVQLDDDELEDERAAGCKVKLPGASDDDVSQAFSIAEFLQLDALDLCLEIVRDLRARAGMGLRPDATALQTLLLSAVDESKNDFGACSARTTMRNSLYSLQVHGLHECVAAELYNKGPAQNYARHEG